MKKLFFVLTLLFSLYAQAQNAKIDSLQRELEKTGEDTMRVNILRGICLEYLYKDNEKTLVVNEKMLKLSTKLDYKAGIYNANQILAVVHEIKGSYEEAKKYANIALEIAKIMKSDKRIASTMNTIAVLKMRNGQLQEAVKDFYKVLEVAEKINFEQLILNVCINISNILIYDLKLYEDSRYYLDKGMQLAQKIDAYEAQITFYAQMAQLQKIRQKYDSCKYFLEKGLEITNKYEYDFRKQELLNDLGMLFQTQKIYNLSNKYFHEVLGIGYKTLDTFAITISTSNIGINYSYLELFDSAMFYLDKSLILSQKMGNIELLKNNHLHISLCHEKKGRYNEALKHYQKFAELKDSISNTEVTSKIADIKTQYETAKKDAENQALRAEKAEQEIAIQNRNMGILSVLSLFLLSTALFALYNYRKRHQVAKARIQEQEGVNQKIGQELHDGLAGTLFAMMQKYEQKDGKLAQELSKIRSEIRFLSHQLGAFLDADLIDKLNTLVKEYKQIYPNITFDFPTPSGNWTNLDKEVQLAVYRIIQQGLTNALQHSGADHITVNLFQNKEIIELEIQDNGKGIDLENLRKGAGILSMEARCQVLGGKLEIIADKGTIILAKMPIKYQKV